MISVHFYKADTRLGKLVQWLGKTDFVHCALQIDAKHVIETDFGGKVELHHMNKNPSKILYFDMTEEDENRLLAKFNALINAKYDSSAIWGFFLQIIKQNPNRYTCVELVCELLESCGFRIVDKNIKPDVLYSYLLNFNFTEKAI